MKRHPPSLVVPEAEIVIEAIRAQGAGGQNVNKVSSAVHLRFDIGASSLPAEVKARLRSFPDQRISADGVLVIKAQRHRSLARNRADALARLHELVASAALVPRLRQPTRPPAAAKARRVEAKARRGRLKALRARVAD